MNIKCVNGEMQLFWNVEVHFKFDCWPSHCWLLILPPQINSQQCWSLITSLLTVDPSHCWLLIVNRLTVDCWSSPPESSQQCWSSITSLLTINPLTVDCWSSIASLLTIDPLTVDCWSSITSLLTVDPLTVDCWSSTCALCREQWDLCAPQTSRAKHGLATSFV